MPIVFSLLHQLVLLDVHRILSIQYDMQTYVQREPLMVYNSNVG